jgi:ElaB/YqjD/DUF883 family membrane-anchored ribosome-binding protein
MTVSGTAKGFQEDVRKGHGRLQEASDTASAALADLIADVEDLIERVGDAADPEVQRLRDRVVDAMGSARRSFSTSAGQVRRQAREALTASDRYVRNQPWEALGIAALAGLAVGYLMSATTRRH